MAGPRWSSLNLLFTATSGAAAGPHSSAQPRPQEAKEIYEQYAARLRSFGIRVDTGIFQAHMVLELENDGPVTILLDSEKLF